MLQMKLTGIIFIASCFHFILAQKLCYAQSIDVDQIFASMYGQGITFENELLVQTKILNRRTLHMLEHNDRMEVTRELFGISDSIFLYTEYFPINIDRLMRESKKASIKKEGKIFVSSEQRGGTRVIYGFDDYKSDTIAITENIFKPIGDWVENYSNGKPYIKGSFDVNGKQGSWNFYNEEGEIEIVKNFKDNFIIDEDYVNLLLHKSMAQTAKAIQNTWTLMTHVNSFIPHLTKHSNSYAFKANGVFEKEIKADLSKGRKSLTEKGTWKLIDFKTVEIKIDGKVQLIELICLSERRVNFRD